jgi:vanillate/3-O-methylgallate O-demethylase
MPAHNGEKSLEELIGEVGALTTYFRNDTIAPHFRARTLLTSQFVPLEVSNWRDEQRAWRERAILFNQSHHMPELFLKGPDALRLLERVGVNSLANLGPERAKQIVACTPRGHVIGDSVLYCHGKESFELVSGMPLLNWVEYQAEKGAYDVAIRRDNSSAYNKTGGRTFYRYQLDGPNAAAIFDRVVEGGAPEIKFFCVARVRIAGCDVVALRHGMAGHKGVELSGPFSEGERVRNAIVSAGRGHGLVEGGTRAYVSSVVESGWMAYPLSGIYTGDALKDYREWLPASSWEANTQIGGSYVSPDIEDYYVTPFDLGYEHMVKFDHDFIGREALERLDRTKTRQRVTLVWNHDDVVRTYASQFGNGPRFKAIEFPVAHYGYPHFDQVHTRDGKVAGLSCHAGYSGNEGDMLSLAMIDRAVAIEGEELVISWGEPNGGTRKPHVERHELTQIRATVAPAPYVSTVRRMKRNED